MILCSKMPAMPYDIINWQEMEIELNNRISTCIPLYLVSTCRLTLLLDKAEEWE